MNRTTNRLLCLLLAVLVTVSLMPLPVRAAGVSSSASMTFDAELTFSDSAIEETVAGSGYSINGTSLEITNSGVYRIAGTCSNGNIEVAKKLSDVVLVLDSLTLTAETTAPIVIKKSTTATVHLEGSSTLTDAENPNDESSSDSFEGAVIKVKSGSTLTFCGSGTLTADGSCCKNGIKGGSTASLIFSDSRTNYVVKAANNGIASDGSVVIQDGTFDIDADNDGIKSTPDAADDTEGTTTDTDSAGTVTIHSGTFDINVDGDGIQADTNLSIYGGIFRIYTLNGYNTTGTKYNTNGNTGSNYTFNPDSMSCKGLKASGDRAEAVGTEPVLYISGGSFDLNTADDAVHSDGYVTVTGGTFTIYTGDDGIHADNTLTLGTENGTISRDPDVSILASYEGLEGGTVYLHQGRYYVLANDDGVNAAGGSSTDNNTDIGDAFTPGGWSWWPGQNSSSGTSTDTTAYNIYVKGGSLYVNCNGDGLDSNGGLYFTGGTLEVFSQSSGDNSAIDADGTIMIDGATIFTAGANPRMDPVSSNWFSSGQKYKTLYSSTSIPSGRTVNVTLSDNNLYNTSLPKSAHFCMYTAPNLYNAPTITTTTSGGTQNSCCAGSWSHVWNTGVTDAGIITYTCVNCGALETQTVVPTGNCSCGNTHTAVSGGNTSFSVSFETSGGPAVEKQVVANGSTAESPVDPTWDGYIFTGWYTDTDFTTQFDFSTPITGDITLYAQWVNLPYFAHKLRLNEQIGVGFVVKVPEAFQAICSPSDYYVTFSGNNGRIATSNRSPETESADGVTSYTYYCNVNSIQMAESITAEFHYTYNGEGRTIINTYSVMDYVNWVTDNSNNYSQELVNLVKSLAYYGHYAQIYLSEINNWAIGTDYAQIRLLGEELDTNALETAKANVVGYAPAKSLPQGVSASYRLHLDSATGMTVYFKPSNGWIPAALNWPDGSAHSAISTTITSDNSADSMRINNIKVKWLGDNFTIQSSSSDNCYFSACALSFVYTVLNSTDSTDAAKQAMAALYNYYSAAITYADNS